jgi:D-alanine-D-alanine ligase
MAKPVLIAFGGVSAEHEVSVITGLQVLEHIDMAAYEPHVLYVTKRGELQHLPGLKNRKGFSSAPRKEAVFGNDARGGFLGVKGLGGVSKIYPYAAYFAFHGGKGEGGSMQGLLDEIDIPFTSPGQESSAIAMNKALTRTTMQAAGIPVAPGLSVMADELKHDNATAAAAHIIAALGLPAIVKPVHLGSSIGIAVAHTEVELQKRLLEAAFVDNEILVEKYLSLEAEYNCAVRGINKGGADGGASIEVSEIERPLAKDEILSFADKYQRGQKKTGGGGMASLSRELPARIDDNLRNTIRSIAAKAFRASRAKGMVRIDFMLDKGGALYLTEINPIPGSMAFYLWEASGIPFKEQITDLIEQAVRDAETARGTRLDYETDIIQKFTAQ